MQTAFMIDKIIVSMSNNISNWETSIYGYEETLYEWISGRTTSTNITCKATVLARKLKLAHFQLLYLLTGRICMQL